jgi:uncharacterized protein
MTSRLQPVPLREIATLAEGRSWDVDEHLDDLASLTPVRGTLTARHLGTVLEVCGQASTIVTLCCDRCLNHFNHPLRCDTRELIWIGRAGAPAPGSDDPTGPDEDALGDILPETGRFDPARWIFEQLHLQLPVVNRCGEHCPGPPAAGAAPGGAAPIDPRWQALAEVRVSLRPDDDA